MKVWMRRLLVLAAIGVGSMFLAGSAWANEPSGDDNAVGVQAGNGASAQVTACGNAAAVAGKASASCGGEQEAVSDGDDGGEGPPGPQDEVRGVGVGIEGEVPFPVATLAAGFGGGPPSLFTADEGLALTAVTGLSFLILASLAAMILGTSVLTMDGRRNGPAPPPGRRAARSRRAEERR